MQFQSAEQKQAAAAEAHRDHGDECGCSKCQHDERDTKPGVPETTKNFREPIWAT